MPRSRCSRRRACSMVCGEEAGLGCLGGCAGEILGGAAAMRLGRFADFVVFTGFIGLRALAGLAAALGNGAGRALDAEREALRFDAAAETPRLRGGAIECNSSKSNQQTDGPARRYVCPGVARRTRGGLYRGWGTGGRGTAMWKGEA